MARVNAYVALDIDSFDLDDIVTDANISFFDNTPLTLDGRSYMDRLVVTGDDGSITFGGSSILFNPMQGGIVGGNVNGIVATAGGSTLFGIHGLSISAPALYQAALTSSDDDDLAIVRAAFSGKDTFVLSGGGDRARGFAGADSMAGNGGNDRLYGDGGNDQLKGGSGNDSLYAGTGADTLTGGRGKDTLFGGTETGSGSGDDFVFGSRLDSAVGTNRDVIRNFTRNVDDIVLSGIDAKAGVGTSNDKFLWNDDNGGRAYHVWWTSTDSGVILRGDVNGNRTADFEIRIAGNDDTFITSADVIL